MREEKEDFWTFEKSWGKLREERNQREEEKGEQTLAKTNILWRKGRRSCIPKGSYTQIISEGEVRSSFSVYNK